MAWGRGDMRKDVKLGWERVLQYLQDGWFIYSSNKGNVPLHWLVNPKHLNKRLYPSTRVMNRLKRKGLIKSEPMGLTIRHTLNGLA